MARFKTLKGDTDASSFVIEPFDQLAPQRDVGYGILFPEEALRQHGNEYALNDKPCYRLKSSHPDLGCIRGEQL
jgi:hypothetical protein